MADREWTQAERTAFLAAVHADVILDRALTPPQITGSSWEDLGAADEHLDRVEAAWDRADLAARSAQAHAELTLYAADVLEAGQLKVEADRLWSARQAAVQHRDRLLSRFGGI
jgi:hypothetical protein